VRNQTHQNGGDLINKDDTGTVTRNEINDFKRRCRDVVIIFKTPIVCQLNKTTKGNEMEYRSANDRVYINFIPQVKINVFLIYILFSLSSFLFYLFTHKSQRRIKKMRSFFGSHYAMFIALQKQNYSSHSVTKL